MFLTTKLLFKTDSSSVERDVILAYYDKELSKLYTHQDFLLNIDLFKHCCSNGNTLKVLYDQTRNLPFVVLINAINDSVTNYSAFFNYYVKSLQSNSDKLNESNLSLMWNKLLEVTKSKLQGVSTDWTVDDMFNSSYKMISYMKNANFSGNLQFSAVDIDSDFMVVTSKYFSKMASDTVKVFTHMDNSNNKTLRQQKPTDELFIKLPSYEAISSPDVNVFDFIPKKSDVMPDYPNKYYEKSDYKKYVTSPTELQVIEGNPNNNSLEIQSNEETYYTAICDWIKYNMKKYYGEINDDLTIIDPISKEYLENLLSVLYMWNWQHNPCVPSRYVGYSMDDDGDNDSDNEFSAYEFEIDSSIANDPNMDISGMTNAVLVLHSFLEKAHMSLGYKVYAEAVIKLARWGSRKCTALSLKDYDSIFLLGSNKSQKNFADVRFYDYNSSKLDGVIYLDSEYSDTDLLSNYGIQPADFHIPVGFVVVDTFIHKKGHGDPIYNNKYYSVLDFIRQLKEKCNYCGFSYHAETDTIVNRDADIESIKRYNLSTVIENYKRSKSELSSNPFFKSPELEQICFAYPKVDSDYLTTLNLLYAESRDKRILKKISVNMITSEDEYREKKGKDPISIGSFTSALSYSIFNQIVPIFTSFAKTHFVVSYQNFTELLNTYYSIMKDNKYISEVSFFSLLKDNASGKDSKEPEKTESVTTSDLKTTEKMNSFSDEKQIKSDNVENTDKKETVHESVNDRSKDAETSAVLGHISKELLIRSIPSSVKHYAEIVKGDEVVAYLFCDIQKVDNKYEIKNTYYCSKADFTNNSEYKKLNSKMSIGIYLMRLLKSILRHITLSSDIEYFFVNESSLSDLINRI